MNVTEILMVFVCGVIFGSFIQSICDKFIFYKKTGELNIIKTDDVEPYIYLDCFEKIEDIEKGKHVVLKVNVQYIDTQK